MREFDFDELDRAVTSALGRSTNDTVPVRSAPATPPADTASRDQVAPRQTVPARRTSGRFMDVVHPSSDMRTAAQSAPASEGSSSEPAAGSAPLPPVISVPSTPPVLAPSEPEASEAPSQPEETPPLQSPFIATNVEKRPLGGDSTPQSDASISDAVTSVAHVSQSKAAQQTPLPKELSGEILALEDTPVKEDNSDSPALSGPMPFSPAPTHPEATKTSGGIYDTEAYHAPTTKPSKKKTGLFITIWILGLIVLGGGIGGVVYFFVLPLL